MTDLTADRPRPERVVTDPTKKHEYDQKLRETLKQAREAAASTDEYDDPNFRQMTPDEVDGAKQ